jgi:hypothetical protein
MLSLINMLVLKSHKYKLRKVIMFDSFTKKHIHRIEYHEFNNQV